MNIVPAFQGVVPGILLSLTEMAKDPKNALVRRYLQDESREPFAMSITYQAILVKFDLSKPYDFPCITVIPNNGAGSGILEYSREAFCSAVVGGIGINAFVVEDVFAKDPVHPKNWELTKAFELCRQGRSPRKTGLEAVYSFDGKLLGVSFLGRNFAYQNGRFVSTWTEPKSVAYMLDGTSVDLELDCPQNSVSFRLVNDRMVEIAIECYNDAGQKSCGEASFPLSLEGTTEAFDILSESHTTVHGVTDILLSRAYAAEANVENIISPEELTSF